MVDCISKWKFLVVAKQAEGQAWIIVFGAWDAKIFAWQKIA